MNEFLDKHGWTILEAIEQDGSSRRYFRAQKGNNKAVLMDASGSAAIGHNLADFIRIGGWLNDIGLKAPEIFEVDAAGGFLLLEDFGDLSFKQAIERGAAASELYHLATDVLKHLSEQDCPLELPEYYKSHVHAGHIKIIEHYFPTIRGELSGDGLINEYLEIWDKIEKTLPPCPQGFMHIDFHAQNLMFLPGEKGIKCCGILDFQGAMTGPQPYDLSNLLMDARMNVSDDLRRNILLEYDQNYVDWCRVLGMQFHCRVIGQFIEMASRDNKPSYLEYIPRLELYIRQALKNSIFEDLKLWFYRQSVFL